MKLREWNARLHGLVVFRSLLDDPVVAKLVDLTDRMEAGAPGYGPVCDAVAQFEAALFEHTTNWGSYLSAAVLEAETVCVRQAAAGALAPVLQTALDSELAFLQALCGLTLDELLAAAGSAAGQAQELDFLPRWETAQLDLPAAYAQRMSEVTEVKTENAISRANSVANPRQIERVIAGAKFGVSIVYDVTDPAQVEEDLSLLAKGMKLLQMDYLGGHGSRGSGRVSLKNFALEGYGAQVDLSHLKSLFDEVDSYELFSV